MVNVTASVNTLGVYSLCLTVFSFFTHSFNNDQLQLYARIYLPSQNKLNNFSFF